MDNLEIIRKHMAGNGWFTYAGAYVLFDGQFGSTGKGLLASVLAQAFGQQIDIVTTNAGPNSGHTAYYNDEEVMTQQIPVASVFMYKNGVRHTCFLNGGAVVDPDILNNEVNKYKVPVIVSPDAAVIDNAAKDQKLSHIASTGKGVGPAMAAKLLRDEKHVAKANASAFSDGVDIGRMCLASAIDHGNRVFIETAQGFSLGINSGFYPYTTSRECSVIQAMADARIPAQHLQKSIVSLRTFPIRVGNTSDGYSGGWYADQKEIEWADIGVTPELTTVTKRVRRVATFSFEQYRQCVAVNRPDVIFLNFCNYLPTDKLTELLNRMVVEYRNTLHKRPDGIILGFGPRIKDVKSAYIGSNGKVFW